MKNIKVVAFDADDTLWVNEPYFREAERKFCNIMSRFGTYEEIGAKLFEIEMKNLYSYGYGAKAFTLSLIETALTLGKNDIAPITVNEIEQIMELGTSLIKIPMELLDGIENVLKELSGKYKLVVATKGDLLDQQRKLERSGLLKYFHHVEIMSDKKENDYKKLLSNLGIEAEELIMIGNSLKSDVLPVINIGGYGIHIPFNITWAHETIEGEICHPKFYKVEVASDLIDILR